MDLGSILFDFSTKSFEVLLLSKLIFTPINLFFRYSYTIFKLFLFEFFSSIDLILPKWDNKIIFALLFIKYLIVSNALSILFVSDIFPVFTSIGTLKSHLNITLLFSISFGLISLNFFFFVVYHMIYLIFYRFILFQITN